MASRQHAFTRGFDADQFDVGIRHERVEDAHRIRTTAHACDDRFRQPSRDAQHLLARFATDAGVKVPHHARIRSWTDHAADDVVTGIDVRDPVPDRLTGRIFERPRSSGHRHHRCTKQLHAEHVQALAMCVLLAHVHHALEAELRTHCRRRHTVLTRARFRDDAPLSHANREQDLRQRIVDLVRARVAEIFALEPHRCTHARRQARRKAKRRFAPDERLEQSVQFRLKRSVGLDRLVRRRQFVERGHQRFRHIAATEGTEAVTRRNSGLLHRRHSLHSCEGQLIAIHAVAARRSNEPPHANMILDSRRRFDARRHIHHIRSEHPDRISHIVRCQPACEYQQC